jgi:hypothetical protein
MLPDRVRYTAQACDWPAQDEPTRRSLLDSRIKDLEARYGLGFAALDHAVNSDPWLAFFPQKGADGRLARDGARTLSTSEVVVDIAYGAGRTRYPETISLVTQAPGTFNTIVWTQELWAASQLLFSNESVSWISNPRRVVERTRCAVRLGDEWRRRNVATLVDATDSGSANVG